MEDYTGNLKYQTLNPILDQNYSITQNEKDVFFVVVNSNNDIKRTNLKNKKLFIQFFENTIESKEEFSNISFIFSIVIFFLVFLIMIPIINKF